jgi:hypothetical protein
MRNYPQQEAVKFRNNASDEVVRGLGVSVLDPSPVSGPLLAVAAAPKGLHQAALHLLDLPRPAFLDSSLTDGHVLSKNVNTARRLLVTRPPRQRPRRIMPVLSHHYVHWHIVFVYGNLLHHLALECTGDQPRARR